LTVHNVTPVPDLRPPDNSKLAWTACETIALSNLSAFSLAAMRAGAPGSTFRAFVKNLRGAQVPDFPGRAGPRPAEFLGHRAALFHLVISPASMFHGSRRPSVNFSS
jgi:hypothetical protein